MKQFHIGKVIFMDDKSSQCTIVAYGRPGHFWTLPLCVVIIAEKLPCIPHGK